MSTAALPVRCLDSLKESVTASLLSPVGACNRREGELQERRVVVKSFPLYRRGKIRLAHCRESDSEPEKDCREGIAEGEQGMKGGKF